METSKFAALNDSLASLTERIAKHKGPPRTLRLLQERRVVVFRQIHTETHRARQRMLVHARQLASLKQNLSLTPREAKAVQIAVELFHVSTQEQIDYADWQAGDANLRH